MNNLKFLIPLFVISSVIFTSCQTSQMALREDVNSPCNDKFYTALQSRDSSTYTQFEKKYFSRKREECRNAITNGIKKKEHDEKQAVGEKIALGMAIAGGIIGGAFLILVLSGGLKQ